MRVPDEVRKCIVFVGLPVRVPDGRLGLTPKGTAFFVAVPSESLQGVIYVYLVTAKHVAVRLEGEDFLARVNTKDGGSKLVRGNGARWWYHPTDGSVDVAVIPWAPPPEVEFKLLPTSLFLSDEIIQSKNIGSGDEVFMTGLFAHLSGSARNLPIVRFGNIAMMPDEPVPTRIGMIEAYLIEARSIGGLSGSPAFVCKRNSFCLLGLMHGHWDIPPENKDVVKDIDSFGSVNMGIAIVVPAKKILEVLNQPELVKMRHREDEQKKAS